MKMKKLNASGIAHLMALLVIVLGVAIVGTYYLVASHADPVNSYSCKAGDALNGQTCYSSTTYAAKPVWTCPSTAPYLNANGSCYPNNPAKPGTAVNHLTTYTCTSGDDLGGTMCAHSITYAATVTTATTTPPAPTSTTGTSTPTPATTGTTHLSCMSATANSITVYVEYSGAGTGASLYRGGAANGGRIASYTGASGSGAHIDTGLSAGSVYSYELRNAVGAGIADVNCSTSAATVAPTTGTTPTPTPASTGTSTPTPATTGTTHLSCMSATANSITVYVEYSGAGTGASLYRGGAANGGRIASYTGASGSGAHIDTGLSAGSVYSYELRNAVGAGIADVNCSTSAAAAASASVPASSTAPTAAAPTTTCTAGHFLFQDYCASYGKPTSCPSGTVAFSDTAPSGTSAWYCKTVKAGTVNPSTPIAILPAAQTVCASGYLRGADNQCGTLTPPICPAGTTPSNSSSSSLQTVYSCKSSTPKRVVCPAGTEAGVENKCVELGSIVCPIGYAAVSSKTLSGKAASYCKFTGCPAGTVLSPSGQCGTLKPPKCPAHTLLVGESTTPNKEVWFCTPESASAARILATASAATPATANSIDGCPTGQFKGPNKQCSTFGPLVCGPGTSLVSGTVANGKLAHYCKADQKKTLPSRLKDAGSVVPRAVVGAVDTAKNTLGVPRFCFLDMADGTTKSAGKIAPSKCRNLQDTQDTKAANEAKANAAASAANAAHFDRATNGDRR